MMRTFARMTSALVVLSFAGSVHGDLSVRFDRQFESIGVGDVFSIDILGDITDPIVGWGLDLSFDETVLSLVGPPLIGPSWFGAFAPDGDALAGLAFPYSVSGPEVLLATLTFSANAIGATDLTLGITPGDLTEGFGLDPSGFAGFTFDSTHVSVVPAPAAALLAH